MTAEFDEARAKAKKRDEYVKRWREKNADKYKAYHRAYNQMHQTKKRLKIRAEKVAATKRFYIDNPAQCRRKVTR